MRNTSAIKPWSGRGRSSAERVGAFMAKATKEAKVYTSWIDPKADYDEALQRFVAEVMGDPAFVAELEAFLAQHRLVERGRINSLSQTTLLLTCPGVPDIYQGTELWDLSPRRSGQPPSRSTTRLRRRLLEELCDAAPELALHKA